MRLRGAQPLQSMLAPRYLWLVRGLEHCLGLAIVLYHKMYRAHISSMQ